MFLLRNWYLNVPTKIFEASKIDGASELQTLLHVSVPLSTPPFVTLFPFQFTWVYPDVGIPCVLASTIVASLPTVALLIAFRNRFFRGPAMQYGGSSK